MDTGLSVLGCALPLAGAVCFANATSIRHRLTAVRAVGHVHHPFPTSAVHEGAHHIPVAGVLWHVQPTLPVVVPHRGLPGKVGFMASSIELSGLCQSLGMCQETFHHWEALGRVAICTQIPGDDVFLCLEAH